MPPLTDRSAELRRTRIGASEVGALLGPHPYSSPARIYARLVDGEPAPASSSAMTLGTILEPTVLRLAAAEHGLWVRACTRTYVHDRLPLAATPDAYAYSEVLGPGLVECKVSGDWSGWADLPPHVEWQARAQLALTGRGWCRVVVLLGSALRSWIVYRDMPAEEELLAAVEAFAAAHLIPRVPPEPDSEELTLRWRLGPGEAVAVGRLEELGNELADATLARRAAEKAEKAARAAFVDELAAVGARVVIGPAGWSARVDERGVLRHVVR